MAAAARTVALVLLASAACAVGASARSLADGSEASSASARAAALRRLLQDPAASQGWCSWSGFDFADDACSNSVDGCCAPNPAKLAALFPKSFAGQQATYNTNPCYAIMAPTSLAKVKQASVDKCYAAGRSGDPTTPCVVHFDPVKSEVSCELQDLQFDWLASCPGSFYAQAVNCSLSTRDKCSTSSPNNCISTFNDYSTSLSAQQKQILSKLMGGASLPKLRDVGSCAVSFLWLTVAGRPGLNDFPNKTFAQKLDDYKAALLGQEQTLTAASKWYALWGTGCDAAGARNRLRVLDSQCSAVNKAPAGGQADSASIAADPASPSDPKLGYLVSGNSIMKCLSTASCEVQADASDGKNVDRVYCRRSPAAAGAYLAAVSSDDVDGAVINAAYLACYAGQNRFSKSACEVAQPKPLWFAEDEAGTSKP